MMSLQSQAFVESRIAQVEKMIRNAVIIENNNDNSDVVALGKTVTFQELPDGEEETYTIVGSAEADPFEGKISNDSPMAKRDRKSTRLNSSHVAISYAVFCL